MPYDLVDSGSPRPEFLKSKNFFIQRLSAKMSANGDFLKFLSPSSLLLPSAHSVLGAAKPEILDWS
jgi:hypothetical protein